jgi:hypothetical protein
MSECIISVFKYDFTDVIGERSDSLKIGEDFVRQFQWATDVDTSTCPPTVNTAKNITGFTFEMDVKRKASDTTPVLTFSSGDSSITIDTAASGLFSLRKTDLETLALAGKEDTYYYDIQYTDASGNKGYLFSGNFQIKRMAT